MPQATEIKTSNNCLFAYVKNNRIFKLQHLDAQLSQQDLWQKLQTKGIKTSLLHPFIQQKFKNISFKNLKDLVIDHRFFKQFDINELKKNACIPIFEDSKNQAFAIENPFVKPVFINTKTKNTWYYLLSKSDIQQFYKQIYLQHLSPAEAVKQLLNQAYHYPASDVHLIKDSKGSLIQLRHEGNICSVGYIKQALDEQVKQIIKLKANMDVGTSNQAQDGHFVINELPEARISTLPNQFGDDMAIRFIKHKDQPQTLDQLGFSKSQLPVIKSSLCKSNGLVLITGPTGSGKTSTAYAALRYIQQQSAKIIVSLEDPIEHSLTGVKQSQVNSKANHGFKQGLRALLRQDTDVMFIGEIRDKESAQIALEAAHTGHLVISTLHTQDTHHTLLRLLNFDLDLFQLGQALKLIISQRLVAGLCQYCKDIQIQKNKKRSCIYCDHKGYKSRILLSETRYFKKPIYMDKKSLEHPELLGDCDSFFNDAQQKINQGIIHKEVLSAI